ncbi:MAG: pyridoxamine 5'-phosphate oxidase family protein [Thermoplasmata archaeon]
MHDPFIPSEEDVRLMGILTDEMRQLLRDQRLGDIATVSPEGAPCISPKGSLAVLDDDTIVWADIHSPRTVHNLATNSQVEILVVDPFARKAARFAGKGLVIPLDSNYWKTLEMYRAEGSDITRIKTVVAIVVNRAEVIRSPIYDTGVSEEEVKALWHEYFVKASHRTILDLIPPRDF